MDYGAALAPREAAMDTSDSPIEEAVEAAARTLHDLCRERRHFRWENTTPAWREQMRAFVRPLVTAVLNAARGHGEPPGTAKQHPTSDPRPRRRNRRNASIFQGIAGTGMAEGAKGQNHPTSAAAADEISKG